MEIRGADFSKWWDKPKTERPVVPAEVMGAPPATPPVAPLEAPPEAPPVAPSAYQWDPYGGEEIGFVDQDYSEEEFEEEETTAGGDTLESYREEWDRYIQEVLNEALDDAPWKRPEIQLQQEGNILQCQHMESSYAVVFNPTGYKNHIDKFPEIRMFAITDRAESVCLRVQNFRPYFYARIDDPHYALTVRDRLETMLQVANRSNKKTNIHGKYILGFEQMKKRSIFGYHRNAPLANMYKITVALPCHIVSCRDALENKNSAVTPYKVIKTFEANVIFELRYMVDRKISGCQWLNINLETARRVHKHEQISTAQHEFICNNIEDITPIEKSDIAPIRILSFDIECRRMKQAGFVNAEEGDPSIVICAELATSQGKTLHRVCFAYFMNPEHKMNSPLPDGTICYYFYNEETMLLAFSNYIKECDPDMFTGWNTNGFDWPYLVKRANELGIREEFMDITRIKNKVAWMRSGMLRSKAYGAKVVNELMCEGRFIYDGLDFILRGQMDKFRDNTLNNIAHITLEENKLDVHFTQIPILHDGSDEDRTTLVEYCLKDATLPLRILEKRMAIVNGVEQSRVTGVPLKWLLTKGQGPKTFSKILRTKPDNVVVPSRSPSVNNIDTSGGYVRDPIQGFVRHPVSTFDFSSLYPSIMQAYNICYSTVESLEWAKANLREGIDYWVPPSIDGNPPYFCFVKEHIQKGVLPDLLTDLLGQRTYVKNLMKQTDKKSELYGIYDGRQMALKVVCNSVYGFLKAFILRHAGLMSAVTAWGQEMIIKTANIIVTEFKNEPVTDRAACEQLGLDYEDYKNASRPTKPANPIVLYGDTDSVVVDFGDIGVQELAALSRRVAKKCTEHMVEPNSLAFESIKLRLKLYKKKKYCSLEILSSDIKPEYNTEAACKAAKISYKGIESKRRDNAKIGSETQQKVLKMILREGDVKGAEEFVKSVIQSVLLDQVDMSKFVISKGLSKTDDEYAKGKAQPAHVILKKRIGKRCRETGEIEPGAGDRVPMVKIRGGDFEKSTNLYEDPVFVQKNGLVLDKKYYVMKQIFGATIRIFTCIYEPEKINLIKSDMSYKKMREFKAYHVLFSSVDPHMLKMKQNTVKVGMGLYTRAGDKCLNPGCRIHLTDPRTVVCESHSLVDAYASVKKIESDLLLVKEAAWKKCGDCAKGRFNVHSCQNMTCDNFFHRNKTVMDVEDIGKKLEMAMKHLTLDTNTGLPIRTEEVNLKGFKPVSIDWSTVTDPEMLKKKPKWGKVKIIRRKKPKGKRDRCPEEVEPPVPVLAPALVEVPPKVELVNLSKTSKQTGLLAFGVTSTKREKLLTHP